MTMNRRRFLSATLAGAGAVMLDGLPGALAAPIARSTDPFQLVPLGKTGLKVSLIGMGTGMRGYKRSSSLTRMGKVKGEAILRYAYERGVRYFDCADLYGSHPFMADVLKAIPREHVVIGSKIWVRENKDLGITGNEDVAAVIDRFRRELASDYIDFVQIHCMTGAGWCGQFTRQMDAMEALREKGVIRAHGVSVHSLDAMKACLGSPWVQSVHCRLNAYGASMDDKDPAAVFPTVKQLRAQGKGIIGMKLIGEGRFTAEPSKIDDSIRFVLGDGLVDTMIVGFEDTRQIDDFAARVKKVLEARLA